MSEKDRDSLSSRAEKKSTSVKPEFSRRIALNKIGREMSIDISANTEQREKLCRRLGILGLKRLEGQFRLLPEMDDKILAEGEIRADATQACIITGEPVDEKINDKFRVRFIPLSLMPEDDILDIETLLAEDIDDIPHDGRALDLGEAIVEQLALCLTPYPRRHGAGLDDFVEVTPAQREDVENKNEKINSFSVLEKLKEKKH